MTAPVRQLEGALVVVTRDEEPDGPLTKLLESRGARVRRWPTLRIEPPADPRPLRRAVADLGGYDWVVFTSVRAVQAVLELRARIGPEGGDPTARRPRVAAVGAATARALRDAGWPVDTQPDEFCASGLVEAMTVDPLEGARVLFPASAVARPTLAAGLRARGARVDEVPAYRTVHVTLGEGPLHDVDAILRGKPGAPVALTFASPSAVESLTGSLGLDTFLQVTRRTVVVVMGPATAAALEATGARGFGVAEPHTFAGMVAVLGRAIATQDRERESEPQR